MKKYLGVLVALLAIVSCEDDSAAKKDIAKNELDKEKAIIKTIFDLQ